MSACGIYTIYVKISSLSLMFFSEIYSELYSKFIYLFFFKYVNDIFNVFLKVSKAICPRWHNKHITILVNGIGWLQIRQTNEYWYQNNLVTEYSNNEKNNYFES